MDAPGFRLSSTSSGQVISGLRSELALIRDDLDSLSGRISSAVDDALTGIHRLKEVNDRLDALFACAAQFARASKDKQVTPLEIHE